MGHTTRINLHCHSNLSDGELSPEDLAQKIASENVAYAALTDHDSIDGLGRFHEALKRHNVGFLPGVEITSRFQERDIHLLAYGFDIHHRELLDTLQHLRHAMLSRVQGPLHRLPSQHLPQLKGQPAPGVADTGKIDIREAIALVHRAGGKTFLAHPLKYETEKETIDRMLSDLKACGLDGLEAMCGDDLDIGQQTLHELAQKHELLICSGTDFHGNGVGEDAGLSVDMQTHIWKRLVRAITSMPDTSGSTDTTNAGAKDADEKDWDVSPWSFLRPRIVLPSLVAVVLFVVSIWGMVLPSIEAILIDRKRDTIRELTRTALSLLVEASREENAGKLTRVAAQEKAQSYIGAIRYGRENKDYFWIQDFQPVMIMHPYRSDLNGQDVSEFTDVRGIHIFNEFAKTVRGKKNGFVEYVWQWKDDPGLLAAKESYVAGFEPWGWIIGTGMYIDDVKEEIKAIEKNLVYMLSGIVALVFIVLLANVRQSLQVEKRRQAVQTGLREAERRYRSLIEATTEGTLLVLDGRCRYGNPTLLQMTGYSAERLELLALSDLLPKTFENGALWKYLDDAASRDMGSRTFEAAMVIADGGKRECIITLNAIVFEGLPGIIVLAKDAYPTQLQAGALHKLGEAAQSAAIGIFQAKVVRQGIVVAMNDAAVRLLKAVCMTMDERFALADLFDSYGDYADFIKTLRKSHAIRNHLLYKTTRTGRTCIVSLSATLVPGENRKTSHVNCVLRDITDTVLHEKEREAFIEKLGVSLLFLQEPVGTLGSPVISCPLETPVHKAAAMMNARNLSCIVVETEDGRPTGFVTDHDFRKRVAAGRDADVRTPVRTMMTAPLVTIPEKAMIYEALMAMEEGQIQHLAVKNGQGRITRVIRAMELLRFHRYGPVILPREIARANSVDEVRQRCEQLPALVKALMAAGAKPRIVAHMTTTVCDAATMRFIELAIEEIGPPPAPFAFIAMGSQGRQEQTLLTDQDNAIIYQPGDSGDAANLKAYFLSLGGKVCRWLSQVGYLLCNGKVMANNPKWCLCLPEWQKNLSEWVLKAEPKELLDLSICLDFRTVYGATELTDALRAFLYKVLKDRPSFLPHLAQNVLLFKPPVRFLGRIIKSGGPRDEAGQLNIKEVLMPLIGCGRLYALHHRLPQTHTLERIEGLVWKGKLQSATYEAITTSYHLLMRLRFQAQLSKIEEGRPLDNCIALNRIRPLDETILKQAFSQIESLQKKIVRDFLGGG